jgi:plastocyanin
MLVSARMHMSGRRLSLAISALACAASALALVSPPAQAGTSGCPQIANKPNQVAHVGYTGVEHLTYCVPVTVRPGQNDIRLNATSLFPTEPGYITRFDPELVYTDGTVPRVDVVHLHHAVWIVNGSPQFAAGEEKTITQLPQGFGWRSLPTDHWFLNDMLHDLVGRQADVYIVWRIDFVPDTSPDAASMKTVTTRWMDASGPSPRVGVSSPIYPVFNALKGWGSHGKYKFPDQASTAQKAYIGPSQSWTPSHPVTLIGTAGHLHPGGLQTDLEVDRGASHRTIFTSKAHYYEPAGAVSWDVAMKATPPDWRVKLQTGDTLSVHATYDTKRASWYEVMGIMPVAVYDGIDAGGVDAFDPSLDRTGVLTHTHLNENRHHGGGPTLMPNPLKLKSTALLGPVSIEDYEYSQGNLNKAASPAAPPRVKQGHSITFINDDAIPSEDTYHTITACRAPCNRDTGIAYPIANADVSFDSGQLGYNYHSFGGTAPAIGTDTWKTPKNLHPGTYTYFCRVHPFMRGSFQVIKSKN